MRFEWDPNKNLSNLPKHRIDFEAAKNLWLDQNRIEIWAPHPVEDRGILIGKYPREIVDCHIYSARRCDSYHLCEACKEQGGKTI
jgi:uncharacterized DUF497 family protein